MRRLRLVSASIVLFAAADGFAQASGPLDQARGYVDAFLSGNVQTLLDHASPELRKLMKDAASVSAIRAATVGEHGVPADESVTVEYVRVVRSASGQTWSVTAAVGSDGRLAGFQVQPAGEAPSEFLDYQTKAEVRLPFSGQWTVFWGGRTLKQNYHAVSAEQRFAYDLLIMKGGMLKSGSSHHGDGKKNGDYYCFGQPILAPAAGRVVAAIDGLEDNVPGQMDAGHPAGNHVVLDLGHAEYLFLAHLQKGSIQVKPGQTVRAGQRLGLCGNSGNSSEPHLHIHLQNTPDLEKGAGLPLQFQHYQANGKSVKRGEPTKGQVIADESNK